MPSLTKPCAALSAAAALSLIGLAGQTAQADYSGSILHTFNGVNGDGVEPYGEVVQGPDGALYGTTLEGGSGGAGIAYKIPPDGQLTVLHAFGSTSTDASSPYAALTLGSDGSLYGTTYLGGDDNRGTVYKITPPGGYQILHSFTGGSDGAAPYAGITIGRDGKLYGATTGDGNFGSTAVYGSLFSMNADGSNYLVQYRFNGNNYATAGYDPYGTLITAQSSSSNVLYGTNSQGGSGNYGTLFAFTPGNADGSGQLSVLHAFGDGSVANDAEQPQFGELQLDASGNLYGVATDGGKDDLGAVYKLTPGGAVTILYSFTGNDDGWVPQGGVTLATDGNLYGTTTKGGAYYNGVVYKLSPTAGSSSFAVVYTFGDSAADGMTPYDRPLEDASGNLLGTAGYGGQSDGNSAYGTIFKLGAGLPASPTIKSAVISPTAVVGGQANATETIKLNKPAPAGGAAVSLSATRTNPSGTDNAVTIPSTVTIAAGNETASFTIVTHNVATTTDEQISASYNGQTTSAAMTVAAASTKAALSSISLSPASTQGGTSTPSNRVYLDGNTTTKVVVALTSSNTAVATVPATVTVQPGYSSHLFTVTTSAVTTTQTVTVTAKYNGITVSAMLTVTPPPSTLSSVTLSPASAKGGTTTTANKVTLTSAATAATTVTLTSSDTAVATVPSSETIAAGSSAHGFTVATKSVTGTKTVTITATANGVSKTATLTVTP